MHGEETAAVAAKTAAPAPAPTTLLSFDIGTRHLAYCVLNRTDGGYAIRDWRVVDLLAVRGTPYDDEMVYVESKGWGVQARRDWLAARDLAAEGKSEELLKRIHGALKADGVHRRPGNDVAVLAAKLFAFLDGVPALRACDAVVLENQPCLVNPVMKSVQMMLYSYFVYHGVTRRYAVGVTPQRVAMASACNKLRGEAPKAPEAPEAPESRGDVLPDSAPDGDVFEVPAPEAPPEGPPASRGDVLPDDSAPDGDVFEVPAPAPAAVTAAGKYRARKQEAISRTRALMAQWPDLDDAWRTSFESSSAKAKDDLSDCLLQGVATFQLEEQRAAKVAAAEANAASREAKKARATAAKAKAATAHPEAQNASG